MAAPDLTALTDEDIDALAPTHIGPTWLTGDDGKWLLPERTIGWQIAGWCAEYLTGEDGGPWLFTREQLRFILWWYAVDETGRFIYRTGVLQRLKGWGKDPLVAVMSLVEFVGPSRFSHFDSRVHGGCVGIAHPQAWVQITAVSQEQTVNTMGYLPILMSDLLIKTYGIKPGAELMRADRGRKKLQAVTSSYRAIEGKRTTFTVLNETHHWITGNGGIKMYETIDGNATKMDSRYLSITNAYLPGEDSVAERQRDAYEKIAEGRAIDVGLMYDSIEAHPNTPLTEQALRIVIPKIRGDAEWLKVDAILQSIGNTSIEPARSRRMWLNQIVAGEDKLYSPGDWESLNDPDAFLEPGDEIVMGFDGGKTDDSTGLVALRIRDRVAFVLGLWERPEGWPTHEGAPKWEVPRQAVDSAVHEAFRIYKVRGFYADVALWESYIDNWQDDYGDQLSVKAQQNSPIGWDMRQSLKKVTLAHERLMQVVFDQGIRHDGDKRLRRHVLNAVRRTNNFGVSFGKESRESPRKVDLYAALLLAHECLHDLRTRGKQQREHSGRGWFL